MKPSNQESYEMKMPEGYTSAPPQRKSNKWKILILIIGGLLVIALLSAGAFWAYQALQVPSVGTLSDREPVSLEIGKEDQNSPETIEPTGAQNPPTTEASAAASTTPPALREVEAELATFDLSGLSAPISEIDAIAAGE